MAIEALDGNSESAREAAVAALTLAFGRDPIMRWMYPSPAQYLRDFPSFCNAFGGAAFGCDGAWISDDCGGAALWLRPGTEPDGPAIEKQVMATVPAAKLETIGPMLEQLDAHHPREPHWYLAMIGVDPAHQGKGLGGELLRTALVQCDEAGLLAYLESSNPANLPLYERHGFEVVTEIRVEDAPPFFPMRRSPR